MHSHMLTATFLFIMLSSCNNQNITNQVGCVFTVQWSTALVMLVWSGLKLVALNKIQIQLQV